MARKPTSAERKERQLSLLRSEMKKAFEEHPEQRNILKQFVEGKSLDAIAEEEHLNPTTVKRRLKELTRTYHDNFTTEVGFWMEILMARYNALVEVLWPAAMNREAPAIKLMKEILDSQMELVGASAGDRQRQQLADRFKTEESGELTVAVQERYDQFLKIMKPEERDVPQLPETTEIAIIIGQEGDEEAAQTTAEAQAALYNDDDAL